jgi:hypothetical protein
MARGDDHFALRFPSEMRDRVKVVAVRNRRSMNAEIVCAVERWLDLQEKTATKGAFFGTPPSPSSELNA